MYQATGHELTLLDTVELGVHTCCLPCVDGHTQHVYIPHGRSGGVSVVSWDDTRLRRQSTLTCVGECYSVGVISRHTLCVCDASTGNVSIVSVAADAVTSTLEKPADVRNKTPYKIAVAGNVILVMYDFTLVVYKNGAYSTGAMIPTPHGLQSVSGMLSDGASRFFISDRDTKAVFILDVRGNLCGKISIVTNNKVRDCTIWDGKLYLGCWNGNVVILPQWYN